MSSAAAMSAVPARRTIETPVARMTINSLPRAREPNPSSEPMSTVIGSNSNACCGRFRSVYHNASTAV